MKRSLWGWMLFCILSTSLPLFSQIATTSLRGTIKDPSGALVPGAKDHPHRQFATAIPEPPCQQLPGSMYLPQIPPAKYTITASAAGFGDQVQDRRTAGEPARHHRLLPDRPSQHGHRRRLGIAQTLNTTDASLGNSADNAEIQAIPSETRNVPDLLSLQPGVLYLPPRRTALGQPQRRSERRPLRPGQRHYRRR